MTPLLDDSDLDGLTSGLSKFDRYAGLLVHAMLADASVCGWKVRVEMPDPFIFITDKVLVDGDIAHRCPNCAAIISGEPIVLESLQESA